MFNSSATCPRGASHRFGALRMDHGPQALRASFAADGVELVLRECRRTAVADAGRCEDLDQIRPLSLFLSNVFTKLLRCQPRVRHLVERGEDPRSGQHAASNRVAKRLVGRRAYTLYGCEPRHQCDVRVFCAIQRGLIGRLSAADPPAVPIEVPSDVNVSVDKPRQKSHRPKVMGDSAGGRRNTFDLRSAYGDDNIPLYTATAIKYLRRTNRYRRVGLWHRHARCAREQNQRPGSKDLGHGSPPPDGNKDTGQERCRLHRTLALWLSVRV